MNRSWSYLFVFHKILSKKPATLGHMHSLSRVLSGYARTKIPPRVSGSSSLALNQRSL